MSFAIGQRVLVFKDENWWPARVVSAELEGLTAPEAGSSVVKYYGYDTCEEVSNTNVEIFDHNPRLATIDGDFAVLVQLAQEDSFALQSVAAPAKKKAASAAVKEVRAEPPPKRNRSEKNAPPRRPETQETEPTHTEKPPATTDDLFYWKSLLESAVQNADLPQARKALVWLVRHRVTYEQLLETKVGVAVTSVCRESALTGISGLARIIIRTWAHLLPAQTQTVVRNHAARRHEPSRVGENASRPEKGLSQRLHDFLSDCDPDLLVNVPQVAAQLEAAALSQADRVKLLTVLGNPKHTELKKKLLTLELTADMFFHLQGDDLLTPAERAKKQKDLEAELAAREEASKFATSDMYECPKCQARKSTYYQQQTRGGDEPMTVFVTCRACNFQWTQE